MCLLPVASLIDWSQLCCATLFPPFSSRYVPLLLMFLPQIPPSELRAAVLSMDPRAVGNEESVAALVQVSAQVR